MLEKYLTPKASKRPFLFGISISLGFLDRWARNLLFRNTWDDVDKGMSKSFLKVIALFNIIVFVFMTEFFGGNFIALARGTSPAPPSVLGYVLFILLFIVLYLIGRDSARLVYYLRTSKIAR